MSFSVHLELNIYIYSLLSLEARRDTSLEIESN